MEKMYQLKGRLMEIAGKQERNSKWNKNTLSFIKHFIKNSKIIKILFSVQKHSMTVE